MAQYCHPKGRTVAALTVVAALSTAPALPALADDAQPQSVNASQQVVPGSREAQELYKKAVDHPGFTGQWFVELEAEPMIAGGTRATIEAQQSAFAASVAQTDVEVENTFERLWTGVTVSAHEAALAAVLDAKHVKAVFPVLQVERPTEVPEDTGPKMDFAADISGVSILRNEFGLSGEGLKIGIIDSGIDIDNKVFGGTGIPGTTEFPNAKVVAGYDFAGDDYNWNPADPNYNPVPEPDEVPDDCMGHGTHVAGIAAGNDPESGFVGVAPEASLGAYRIYGCTGTTSSEMILAAMERAAADGMDIVNMSIVSPFQSWPNYPTSVAADNLVEAGVTVVASQGNNGQYGLFAGGAPASGRHVISVGSVDNSQERWSALRAGGELFGYLQTLGSPAAPLDGELEIAVYPDGQKTGAVDLPGEPFEGRVVLVSRGDSGFDEKAAAAQKDGAAAVVLYNNEPGKILVNVAGEVEITIPVVTVTQDVGVALEELVAASEGYPATLEWTDEWVTEEVPGGGLMSAFSSWGISGELDIKPDVLAPGGQIFSAYPLDAPDGNGSGFVSMSGTSMAAPHTAGAVALLLEANPDLDPVTVKAIVQNTARPIAVPQAEDHDVQSLPLEPVHRQGAGLIDMPAALRQANPLLKLGEGSVPSTVTPSKINLRDGDAIETTTLTITNSSDRDVSYKLSVDDRTSGTYGPNAEVTYGQAIALADETTFSAKKINVPAGESRTVDVTIGEPQYYQGGNGVSDEPVDAGTLYGAYIVIEGDDGSTSSVPFFGVKGDYETDRGFILATLGQIHGEHRAKALGLDPSAPYVPPTLASVCDDDGCGANNLHFVNEPGYTFNVAEGDLPLIALHIENPIRGLAIEAFESDKDGAKGEPVSEYGPFYLSGGVGASVGYNFFVWDGTVQNSDDPQDRSPVKPGHYVLEVTAIKGMGQATKSENTETWLSQPFTVASAASGSLIKLDNGWDGTDLVEWGPLPDAEDYYVGDWDGDGVDSLMWRTGNVFSYANVFGDEPVSFTYGRPGDVVLVGDWDGDGKDTVAIRRGAAIHYKNALAGGHADDYFYFGRAQDLPLVGDWDGDGKDTISVRRGVTNFVNNTLSGGSVSGFDFGSESDWAIPGDWNGDGTDTISLISGGRDRILINNSVTPSEPVDFEDLPVHGANNHLAGDWNGDGVDTLGYFWHDIDG